MTTSYDLKKLQFLLFGREQHRLDELQRRVEDPERRADDVADILVEALQRTPDPEKLSVVISEPTAEAIRISIQRDSEHIAGILYPAVLPAIRKSIEQTMQNFMESIDLLVKQQFSVDSLKWRFESLRTGVPFHEIMLRNLLRYQVEEVFLIQRGSGLLIEHVSASDEVQKDQDAVSAMLTAIESFVHESFAEDSDDRLNRVTVGDRIVYLEHGPNALIASVVRGVATPAYLERLKQINEEVHAAFSRQLQHFSGGDNEINGLENILSRALGREFQIQQKADKADKASRLKLLGGLLAAALLLMIGYLGWGAYEKSRVDALMEALTERPGIVASRLARDEGQWVVAGLLDPAAAPPDDITVRLGLDDKVTFRFEPYLSLAPEMVVTRAARKLNIPATVTSELKGETLHLSGNAPLDWYLSMKQIATLPAGVTGIDRSALKLDPEEIRALLTMRLPSLKIADIHRAADGSIEVRLDGSISGSDAVALKRLANLLAPRAKILTRPQ